jgi:deoxycytidine triphosphate deaminase/DNA-binding XRE family transcriptional regulator
MERLGLNQVSLGKRLGVTRQTVNNVMNGRQPISRALSAALARLTHRPSDYWLQSSFSGSVVVAPPHGVLGKNQILQAVERGLIAISPFERSRIRAASIELTFGALAADGKTKLPTTGGLRLRAGRSAIVLTQERLQLSTHLVGHVGIAAELAGKGLGAFPPLQVEPGFAGHLCIVIFNAGAADIPLRIGEPLFALELSGLAG